MRHWGHMPRAVHSMLMCLHSMGGDELGESEALAVTCSDFSSYPLIALQRTGWSRWSWSFSEEGNR